MARINKKFKAFGTQYRTTQLSAVIGLDYMARQADLHPCEILATTDVLVGQEWHSLSEAEVINQFVADKAGVISPMLALNGVVSLVRDFNFGFIDGWKSAKVPQRFIDQSNSVSSVNVDPIIQQLIQDGIATLKELEEYYSMEDAFKLFDSLMVKGINQAISQEAATKKSRR